MTVAAKSPPIVEYEENGTSKTFAAPFRFLDSSHLVVERVNPKGEVTRLSLNGDYTVAGGGSDNGGTVTTSVAAAAGTRLRIRRFTPRQQALDYTTNDIFPADSHESALDRAALIDQEQDEARDAIAARSLLLPDGETAGTLPRAAFRANLLPAFDDQGHWRLSSVSQLAISLTPYIGGLVKGDPGGNVMSVGSFAALRLGGILIPLGTDRVRSSDGWDYIADPIVDAAHALANPYSTFISGNGRGFRLAETVVTPQMFGGKCNGIVPDTEAAQAAIAHISERGGGDLLIEGNCLISTVFIAADHIRIRGRHRFVDRITVMSGGRGLVHSEDWCSIEDLGFFSQGTKNDGSGTTGVVFEKAVGSSSHLTFNRLYFRDFNGPGLAANNLVDVQINMCLFSYCATGWNIGRNGTGGADFSTTVTGSNVYFSACGIGLDAKHLYRSRLNIIAEYCNTGFRLQVGDVTLNRPYLENNYDHGAEIINGFVTLEDDYSNKTADAIVRKWDLGVVAAADRGYRQSKGMDQIAKRFGILGQFGVAVQYLSDHGTTDNLGLKYGTATLAMKRGPTNLLSPGGWEGEGNGAGNGTELIGWSSSKQGYQISGTSTGARGMRNIAETVAGQTYVLDWKALNLAGSPLNTARVGTNAVTNGMPFTASSSGPVIVKLFGIQTGPHENIVKAISLARVDLADATLIADLQHRLAVPQTGRGDLVFDSPPLNSRWAVNEFYRVASPVPGGAWGQVCTTAGAFGSTAVFSSFGQISGGS